MSSREMKKKKKTSKISFSPKPLRRSLPARLTIHAYTDAPKERKYALRINANGRAHVFPIRVSLRRVYFDPAFRPGECETYVYNNIAFNLFIMYFNATLCQKPKFGMCVRSYSFSRETNTSRGAVSAVTAPRVNNATRSE